MAGSETLEFRHEFVQETHSLLRRRLRNFVVVVGGIWLLFTMAKWFLRLRNLDPETFQVWPTVWKGVNDLLAALAFGAALYIGLNRKGSRQPALVASIGLVAVYGVHLTVAQYGLEETGLSLFLFMAFHLLASAHFPWTASQSLIPVGVFVLIHAGYVFTDRQGNGVTDSLGTILSAVAGVPGIIACSVQQEWRERNFGYRFMRSRYGKLRDELASARRIHEALFPSPCREGAFDLTYQYEPMRHIGGDYLHVSHHCRPDGSEVLSVVVVDVTGHGIPAALTVNRLHGEVELMFAADPEVDPGTVLKHLNRYVNLTLAKHSIYATALCLRFDSREQEVVVANGGHPPAFLLGVDGTIEEVGSTAFVLGAARDDEFDPAPRRVRCMPGDTMIAYTDGAIEARAPNGRMLRIEGFRSMIARAGGSPGERAGVLLAGVAEHRGHTPTEDDTLIVEIHRVLRRTGAAGEQAGSSARAGSAGNGVLTEAGVQPVR
ncbi:MAG: SpoIIE family protein phosphatase [Phycisphaerales bacterium]|nr:SpoIIE family protein phosphatase [Phycisphaerales bacterium]